MDIALRAHYLKLEPEAARSQWKNHPVPHRPESRRSEVRAAKNAPDLSTDLL
jgi:hypothetical protein